MSTGPWRSTALIDGVARALLGLQDRLELHLLTADTHGTQAEIDRQLAVRAVRIPPGDEAASKAASSVSWEASAS
jgi:hypothetical protein